MLQEELQCGAVSLFIQDYVNEKVWRAGSTLPGGAGVAGGRRASLVAGEGSRGETWNSGLGIVGRSIDQGRAYCIAEVNPSILFFFFFFE